jgi:lysophospholipase L1-like esterase
MSQKPAAPASKIEDLDKNLKPVLVAQPDALEWLPWQDARLRPLVKGLPWEAENGDRLCRLPLRAKDVVRSAVWELSQCLAGGRLHFRTNSSTLAVRFKNPNTGHMSHMPLTGSNGVCLYSGGPGRWRLWGVGIPDQKEPAVERQFFKDLSTQEREFLLYMPLYKGLESLEIGIVPGSTLSAGSAPALPRPVVFYGTSITQGGCASLSGSDFVNLIGRQLNLDIINLGFSGNGKGELELADLLGELDPELYVIDHAANNSGADLRRTLTPFMDRLRSRRPNTPILMLTCLNYGQTDWNAGTRERHEDLRDVFLGEYLRRRQAGDRQVHFADGFAVMPFGHDSVSVDGCHPTDGGFAVMAERLGPYIAQILLRNN